MASRIFLADDNPVVRQSLERFLKRHGYDVASFETGPELLEEARVSPPDLALVDIRMPVMDGIEVLKRLRQMHPGVVVIMITAFGSPESAVQALKAGAFEYISKPIKDMDALLVLIENALEPVRLRKQIEVLREKQREAFSLPDLVAESPQMRRAVEQATLAARNSQCTVLVTGETGTGKELISKLIHLKSDRFEGPFIVVNCGALPGELVESELFGYARGSFTGARAEGKQGRLEAAHGGSILLDEIGEMPQRDQVKLLRFLETREIQRIGSTTPVQVDVRVIAATNQRLEEMVEDGEFRKDLFYRLNAFRIHIPPLRERREDIAAMANLFLYETAKRLNKNIARISQEAMSRLLSYPWPGNVRELRNTIERAVLVCDSDAIRERDLVFLEETLKAPQPPQPPAEGALLKVSEIIPLAELERLYISRVMEATGDNISEAARRLGISRNRLRRKISGAQEGREDE